MSAIVKDVTVQEAVPAVTKKVLILQVSQEVNDILNANRALSIVNRIFYPSMLVVVLAAFFFFDIFGVLSEPCVRFHHGECADDRGLGLILGALFTMLVLMIPYLAAGDFRAKTKALLLKQAGWDGTSEYELEVEKQES